MWLSKATTPSSPGLKSDVPSGELVTGRAPRRRTGGVRPVLHALALSPALPPNAEPGSCDSGAVERAEQPDVASMRRVYAAGGLDEADMAAEPMDQFTRWFGEALAAGLPEPNAMVVATASAAGVPSARTVLMKGFSDRGFVFYTNFGSAKGRDLSENPKVALLFPWHPLERQVRVTGVAERLER